MIDVHSHIVFDVDDGPKTLEESLDLIGESYAQGVRTIVSTSHRRKGMFETPEDKIFANFSKVKEEAEALYPDLTICYGGELYYTSDIVEKLEKNLIPRMHNTQFALIEFSARTSWKEIHSGLSNVLRAGVTPIVAHIERYDALEENADRVREIINMGCYTQVNSSHVLKPKLFGDKDKRVNHQKDFVKLYGKEHFVVFDGEHSLNDKVLSRVVLPIVRELLELH